MARRASYTRVEFSVLNQIPAKLNLICCSTIFETFCGYSFPIYPLKLLASNAVYMLFYLAPPEALCTAAADGVMAKPVLSCMALIADVTGVATPVGAGVVARDAGALRLWAM